MPREDYRASLDDLRANVESMAEDVLKQLQHALDALDGDDHTLARTVIDGDDHINQQYLDLESDCVDLIALQQPVASDLRFVVASFKILTDLERIADLATNLARYALADISAIVSDVRIQEIGETAVEQVRAAVDAYVAGDADACRAIAGHDDELDTSCQTASEAVVRELIASDPDGWEIEQRLDGVSRLLLTIRDLERVGDHAVNIAARTLYMDEGSPELIY
ncbi:phosphate signaling complex protein PhoU [Halonotius roseus]|uniref:Phosphate-specific transport system accessory protein PhoU n=1 Tax=Halonotius roseus TaxID=2511997 RepID=A0A544QP90_9EURY|nr:phosphate signaling complex protein PhoU [Halonotius roseus]TQQ80719.1 phosphate signaling complex protein PhoU [Halonotius roseus]